MIRCESINNEAYSQILTSLDYCYDCFDIEDISDDKILILINEKIIKMTNDNLLFIRSNYTGQLDQFININIDSYIEIINDNINELYKITGKTQLNSKFLKKLKQAGLDKNDGAQIKNEIIVDIKSWKVGKDNENFKRLIQT